LPSAACRRARVSCSRAIETAAQQATTLATEEQRAQDELTRLTDAAAQAGLQSALAVKLEREQALGPNAANTMT
jgi:chromosome segregation protein